MKKTLKKILCSLLVVVMCLTVAPLQGFVDFDWSWLDFGMKASAFDATGQCGENVYWTYDSSTGELVISGVGEMTDYKFDSPFQYGEGIKSVVIENGVTSIGENAFYSCDEVTSITIPSSVTRIGEVAFWYCLSLKSIDVSIHNNYYKSVEGVLFNNDQTVLIQYPLGNERESYTVPTGVKEIASYAFHSCRNLTTVKISDSVTKIGSFTFWYCYNLMNIVVDENNTKYASIDGVLFNKDKTKLIQYPGKNGRKKYEIPCSVLKIDSSAFRNCKELTEITMPDSITSIGTNAFELCDKLAKVYYDDSVMKWKMIDFGMGNDDLINAEIEYKYGIGKKFTNVLGINYMYTYSDDFFTDSSYNYNHDLAIMSNCLAISAMIKEGQNALPVAAETLFEEIKFDNYTHYGYGVTPEINSIACVIASKNLTESDETIIAVAIRGAGYEAEWGGNFNLGKESEHEGFRLAKEKVLCYLSKFIRDNKSDFCNNIKFWITGYSRAAATSNLVAAVLDDGATKYEDISSLDYSPSSVYAYTFETPIPTRDTNAKAEKYGNIFNIINRIDYVPKVAPETWGYSRYGVDCYLPSNETYGATYSELKKKMNNMYKEITGKKYSEGFTFYDADFSIDIGWFDLDVSFVEANGKISQSRFLDEFVSIVAKNILKNVNTYVSKYQHAVQKLMVGTLGGGTDGIDFNDDLIKEIKEIIKNNIKTLLFTKKTNILKHELAVLISSLDYMDLTYTNAYNLLSVVDELMITGVKNYNYVWTLLENANVIKPAHYPEINFAWVASMSGSHLYNKGENTTYRVAKYNCPINISLYNNEDKLLATIIDDQVITFEDCHLSIYIDGDGQKCFCLPSDSEYYFEIVGTDEGEMSCTFSEYDFAIGENLESVNYYEIPIKKGAEFTVEVSQKNGESIEKDVIIWRENQKKITASEKIDYDNNEKITVIVETESTDSIVFGGGTYSKGEFSKVQAFPYENEKFVGWYIDGELISDETTYRFMPEYNCVIVAKFVHKHSGILEEIIEPTCTSKGYTTYTCSCGESYIDDEVSPLGHNELSDGAIPATCTNTGLTEGKHCSVCGTVTLEQKIVDIVSHIDNNDDGKCDNCDAIVDTSKNCSCSCHKGGIAGFFFKIILFFQKIFRTNKTCACGIAHY